MKQNYVRRMRGPSEPRVAAGVAARRRCGVGARRTAEPRPTAAALRAACDAPALRDHAAAGRGATSPVACTRGLAVAGVAADGRASPPQGHFVLASSATSARWWRRSASRLTGADDTQPLAVCPAPRCRRAIARRFRYVAAGVVLQAADARARDARAARAGARGARGRPGPRAGRRARCSSPARWTTSMRAASHLGPFSARPIRRTRTTSRLWGRRAQNVIAVRPPWASTAAADCSRCRLSFDAATGVWSF